MCVIGDLVSQKIGIPLRCNGDCCISGPEDPDPSPVKGNDLFGSGSGKIKHVVDGVREIQLAFSFPGLYPDSRTRVNRIGL